MTELKADSQVFVTVTGTNYYFELKPFALGTKVSLIKDVRNHHDDEAIAVILPLLGKVGYVANSPYTVIRGTYSAGRLYDYLAENCLGIVRFITDKNVILEVYPDKRLDLDIDIDVINNDAAYFGAKKLPPKGEQF
ncbi:MAG: HIRAN domain-containing protein [Lactobacillus sp.]|jgi:hypothetical protein|nr:HIRAN domain-containing protein [Lactobacillus sp.]